MDNTYTNGKIYKIWDNEYTKCYIGSTTVSLSRRMVEHRSSYRKYKDGTAKNYISIYGLFDEFDIENCKIELFENYPCINREELRAREGQCVRENACINKRIEGRTKKEYCDENRDIRNAKNKTYRELNNERINQTRRDNYNQNKDNVKERKKEYIERNTDKIKQQRQERYERNKDVINEQRRLKYKMSKQ